MIADALLIIGLLMVIAGAVKRRERWGLAMLSAGIGIIVATALTAWTDVSDSFLSGVRDGFRGTGE